MENPNFDPAQPERVGARLRRVVRKDGQFNVRRRGTAWKDIHPYHYLINLPWPVFVALMFACFVALNLVFALTYCTIRTEQLHGAEAPTAFGRFMNTFFFSSQMLTTVGYGTIGPGSFGTNLVASFEAMVGLMGFAVATGFLVGRVTRPSARIGFSKAMVVAPCGGGTSLQFRIVNRNVSNLMELEARVMLMTVEKVEDGLRLEVEKVSDLIARPGADQCARGRGWWVSRKSRPVSWASVRLPRAGGSTRRVLQVGATSLPLCPGKVI